MMTTTKTAAQAAEYVLVPPEAVPMSPDGLLTGIVAHHTDWAIPTEFGCRVVDERMAHGWNECRKAMLAAVPVRATGGELRELLAEMRRGWPKGSCCGQTCIEWAERLEAALSAPAIAPGGDAYIGNEWADAATNGLQWLRNVRDGISTAADGIAEMESNITRIRALPAAGNAEAVDDAIPRGVGEALQRMIEDGLLAGPASAEDARLVLKWMNARYDRELAALTHAAQEDGAPADYRFTLSPRNSTCNYTPADQAAPQDGEADLPAADDVSVVVADLRRLGKEDGWLCATAGADIIEALLAAQEAARG